MPGKYIFYDIESTGRGKKENRDSFASTPKWEQILQIAAIVVDENFQPTNQNLNEFCRLRTSVIPQPGALLVTKRSIKESLSSNMSSYELIKKIYNTFEGWKKEIPESVWVGHNSLEFDETVLEYNLFNNLFFPYITRTNRGDTLNLAIALYALNPTLIKTSKTTRGNPSFRLPELASLNDLPVEFAHDAYSDVKTSISLMKYIHDADQKNWEQLSMTMNKNKAIDFVNKNKGFCYLTSFAGRIKMQALSMVCESQYKGWFHTIDLQHDPEPLLAANNEEFKKLIKKKNRYVICNQHPILLAGKFATQFEPYDKLGSSILNERVEKVYRNKSLAKKFENMEIDRQLEKEETLSQDNIFPESKANLFINFGQGDIMQNFHNATSWNDKYQLACQIKDPRANFILKRLIFDESPEVLSEDDFKLIHRELSERLLLNQERPYTTIPEAMGLVDTEMARIEDEGGKNREEDIRILNEYNLYLDFLEKYFSDKNAKPLKTGKKLVEQIFD
ncbi:MAG: hypothetical protein CMI95_06140 [Pelagibacteraceae bacterium]|nr:hypothetical protein [Pelagibacteraceae bacterium]